MKIRYSKNSADIATEDLARLKDDAVLLRRQREMSAQLAYAGNRATCLLCQDPLGGDSFEHRGIPFVLCTRCGHIQTRALPPDDYPPVGMQSIYPSLTPEEFQDRKERIYRPKLDWVLDCLHEQGYTDERIRSTPWFEIGTGAGCFLACLQDFGVEQFCGIDRDPDMVGTANARLGGEFVTLHGDSSAALLDRVNGGILTAFFVLEHFGNPAKLLEDLKRLPNGTVLAFSVPVFGLSCLLENMLPDTYARNLDAVLHTQLYTDKSIAYAMGRAGFEITHQWVFGQDAQDLARMLLTRMRNTLPVELYDGLRAKLERLLDPLQRSLDEILLSDQRHILAVKGTCSETESL